MSRQVSRVPWVRRSVSLCSLLTALGVFALAGTAPAQSATLAVPESTAQIIRADMVPDCSSVTDQVRAYMEKEGIQLCGVGGGDGVSARNQVSGLCGSSAIYLQRHRYASFVTITWGFSSTVGAMGYRALDIQYSVNSTQYGFSDVSFMNNPVHNGSRSVSAPRTARVNAALYGSATTIYGLTCYMRGPTASL